MNLLLIGILLVIFIWILYLVRNGFREGFEVKEIYDSQLFFAPLRLVEICPFYDSLYQNVYKSEKVDESGQAVPDDVAKKKTEAYLANELASTGLIQCPYTPVNSTDINAVHTWVLSLDDKYLISYFGFLLYFAKSLQKTYDDGVSSASEMNKHKVEGFITECSRYELEAKDIIPLQCINPLTETVKDQTTLKSQDYYETQQALKKKIEITQKLKKLWDQVVLFKKMSTDPNKEKSFSELIELCKNLQVKIKDLQNKLQS